MNNNKISYNPIISYDKDFYSEKSIINEQSIKIEESKEPNKIEELQNIIANIQLSTIGLSEDIKDLIAGVLDPLVDFIEDNKEYLEDIKNDEEDDSETEEDEDKKDDKDEEDEVIFIPIVNIIDNEIKNTDTIKKTYKENILDLINNYFTKLKAVLDNYWINIGVILIGKPIEYKKFILSDLTQDFKVGKDKQHLLDLAMRSQIHRMSKSSYASKICPVDETLVQLRSLKMVTDLMLRYLDLNVEDTSTEYGNLSKTILETCIINYNNKYNYTYKSAYKYLNSSVELVDEVLQLSIQEAKSKKFLK